ncbi:MAG: DUF3795 domain-containing protein [Oscillospiraceae bacterium]|nr:DUF3795 domain-containing protein [Oscillospiraceae bacterium]
MNKYSPDLAGICGLFCGSCPAFPEECEGCLSGKLSPKCADCRHGFRSCAKEKGVTRCNECSDFPCRRLEDFIPVHVENGIVHHKNVINDLKLISEIGAQNWVDLKVKENTCSLCGEIIIWHEAETHKCKMRS